MLNYKFLPLLLLFAFVIGLPNSALAKQCIKNDSGAVLDITWYNSEGKHDENASNHSVSVGFEACQDNKNLGFAHIACSGCIFAELSAQTAVTLAGAGAYGVCVVATGGGCALAAGVFEAGTQAAVMSIPPAFKGKKVAVPNRGKTMVVKGNAFGLKVN